MTADANQGGTARQFALKAMPFLVVALAGMAVRTPVAAAYPVASLLLFLWIVSDTMMLALIARSSGRPGLGAIFGVMAGASIATWLGAPAALRDVIRTTPVMAAGMTFLVVIHLVAAGTRARSALRTPADKTRDRWIAAASEILPAAVVRLGAAELSVIHMALFRWGGPADVPANCRAFSYHRHLAPICTTLLVLSAIEIAVYHLLIGHWSRTAAIVMFVLSDVGFVYLMGLIKSFRFRPVLLTPEGIRIRAGFLIDQPIAMENIDGVETGFVSDRVRDPATFNAALLAWPNIIIRLKHDGRRPSILRKKSPYNSIAFRLDEPEPFARLLCLRLNQRG